MKLKKPYTVMGYDTFSYDKWVEGKYATEGEAIAQANLKGGSMMQYYVYDENNKLVHTAGTF